MKKVIERLNGRSGDLQLQKDGDHYEIISGGVFLMSTRGGEGERVMVRLALSYLQYRRVVDVLIGGLGVGYSIMEALEDKRVANIDVVELEEAVIRWNEQYFGNYNENVVNDEKVRIICDDLLEYIGRLNEEKYELVVLDVDNGPDWLVREENRGIYQLSGISMLERVISPGGLLVVWSATQNSKFLNNLSSLFYDSFIKPLNFYDDRGRKYCNYLYIGRKNKL